MQTQTGELTKLIIKYFSDEQYNDEVGEFEVMLNPNQYTLSHEIEYGERQPAGTEANAPSFSNMKPQELALEFIIDGTGVTTGRAEDVQEKVDAFLDNAYAYDGETHRNRYLRILWSTLVFDCVLRAADVTYNLFDSSGAPLRSTIAAKFIGFVNDELRERMQETSSPDLTHVRTLEGLDRIDRMSERIYRTPEFYIDVAAANGLDQFRNIEAGTRLHFPPLVKR